MIYPYEDNAQYLVLDNMKYSYPLCDYTQTRDICTVVKEHVKKPEHILILTKNCIHRINFLKIVRDVLKDLFL